MDRENELSPIMKRRLAELGELSQEDTERMKEIEDLETLLRQFYKDHIDAQALWEKLKEFEKQGKQFLLRDAYMKLRNSFKWRGLPIKFVERDDGTLYLEFREEAEKALVLELTDSNFDDAVKEHPLLVVDCWAEWCAPCRMIAPIIEELAEAHQGKVTFGKLNVDHNRSVATRYQIMSIPTLLVFKDGQLVDTKLGAMPKQMLESEIVKHTD